MKRLILITGGTGYIGSFLVEALISRGEHVRCLVERKSDITYLRNLGVELVYGDLLDKELLREAVTNVNIVYHLAALVDPFKVFHSLQALSRMYYKINVIGTMNLVEVCLDSKIQKFIYYSSVAVTGFGAVFTESSPCNPFTDYAKSKLEAERFLLDSFIYKKFPVVIIRPGSVYGPRNKQWLTIFKLVRRGIFPFIGKGDNSMPICYIDNVIKATLLIEEKGKLGEIYFLVDDSCNFRELVQTIAKIMRVNLFTLYFPKNIIYAIAHLKEIFENIVQFRIYPFCLDLGINAVRKYSTNWVCSNDKIKKELGYAPEVDLKEAIYRLFVWYKENGFL